MPVRFKKNYLKLTTTVSSFIITEKTYETSGVKKMSENWGMQ